MPPDDPSPIKPGSEPAFARDEQRRPHGIPAHRCAGAASAMPRCCARWTRCRARHFVLPAFAATGLCRPGAADRLRADHQPALRRRLHDRAARVQPRSPRARDRHRLGLPGGDPVAARRRGRHRSSATARSPTARARARAARLSTMSTVLVGDGFDGRAGARALRPHHRHGGGRDDAAGAGRAARRGRHDGAAARAA